MLVNLKEKIQHYLYFGYVPCNRDITWLYKPLQINCAEFEYTPRGAALILDAALDELFDKISPINGYVVIPISGGYDSRVLLGAALERFERSKIKTLSYGVPGLLDYEIGAHIAKVAGVEHHAVNLDLVQINFEELRQCAVNMPWTYLIEGYYNSYSFSQVARSSNDILLSGFMGDPITGGHISFIKTKIEAINEFVIGQQVEKKFELNVPGYDPRQSLPALPNKSLIPHSELLDFGVRQSSCIAPCVTPVSKWMSWNGNMGHMQTTKALVLAPFIQAIWASYWIQAPKEYKIKQRLYRDMIHYKFPKFASLASKNSLGAKTQLGYFFKRIENKIKPMLRNIFGMRPYLSPTLNYLNFSAAFFERDDFKNILGKSADYLKDNNVLPYVNIQNLIDCHYLKKKDLQNSLNLLIGLAINHSIESKKSNQ